MVLEMAAIVFDANDWTSSQRLFPAFLSGDIIAGELSAAPEVAFRLYT